LAIDAPLLSVTDLAVAFGGLRAVDGASFDVADRSITALIGPNGAGKTTLFNIVSGFLKADGGSVRLRGEDITGKPSHRIAQRGLVRTFQLTHVLGKMKVIDNVLLACPDQPGENLARAVFMPRAGRRRDHVLREEARDMLNEVGLLKMADEYAATLSGGQRKLLELARALITRPRILLLDEPMAGVNPTLGNELLAKIQLLGESQGMTVLFVEHDMSVVMGISDAVVVMAEGKVIAQGPPEMVRTDSRVIDAYLGADPASA
jgi:neutral amino acid transport system ATP-binding protein